MPPFAKLVTSLGFNGEERKDIQGVLSFLVFEILENLQYLPRPLQKLRIIMVVSTEQYFDTYLCANRPGRTVYCIYPDQISPEGSALFAILSASFGHSIIG